MPPKLDACVKALIKKGYSKNKAWAICTSRYKKKKGKKKK